MDKSLFFIAILPPPHLQSEITAIKHEFKEFRSVHALRSPPHITLMMPFKYRDDRIQMVSESLRLFALQQAPFPIDLDGFGSFEPRVIYIRVKTNPQLKKLHRELTTFLASTHSIAKDTYKNRGFEAHMTVAFRDLSKRAFYDAWPHFRDRAFTASWTSKSLSLLNHDGKQWNVHASYSYDNSSNG